jgi:hypothetical protein
LNKKLKVTDKKMNALHFSSLMLFITLFNLLFKANQTERLYMDDFAYDDGLGNLDDVDRIQNSNEVLTPSFYRLDRDLRLSQGENKNIGNILSSIRKNLVDYIIEKGIPPNKEDLQGTLVEMVQKQKKEKKPTIRIPFKWGR